MRRKSKKESQFNVSFWELSGEAANKKSRSKDGDTGRIKAFCRVSSSDKEG